MIRALNNSVEVLKTIALAIMVKRPPAKCELLCLFPVSKHELSRSNVAFTWKENILCEMTQKLI